MEMMNCLVFGFMLAQKKKTERLVSNLGGVREEFQKIVHMFSPESSRPKTIVLFFNGIVMGVALLMSASR
jgi:hypothetical protein